jgi:cytochrome P450
MATAALQPMSDAMSEVDALPLAELDPARADRFRNDSWGPVFERLRREDPVHLCETGEFGRYWSITKYNDIMAIDTDHKTFSSEPASPSSVRSICSRPAPSRACRCSSPWTRPSTTSSARS